MKRMRIVGLASAAVLLLGAASSLQFKRLRGHQPDVTGNKRAQHSASSDVDPRLVRLGELCERSGGSLWKRAVLVDPAKWLDLGRCPDPPPRARLVWDSQPEYGRYFERCIGEQRRVVDCVADIAPICSGGVLDDSIRERWRTFGVVLGHSKSKTSGVWQFEDVDLRARSTTAKWQSVIWRIVTDGQKRRVETCLREGARGIGDEARRVHEATTGASGDDSQTANVDLSLAGLHQWDCSGTRVFLHGSEVAEQLKSIGCERLAPVPRGGEAKIHLSTPRVCAGIHSALESPKALLACEGNDLFFRQAGGVQPVRPSWWYTVED
jgi:hypothetical protein